MLLNVLLIVPHLVGTGHAQTCAANEFKKAEVIAIGCNAVNNQQVPISLSPNDDKLITHFPVGTKDIDITLSSSEGDLDVCLFDAVHGSCVHGNYNCVAGYGCRVIGGAGGGPKNYAGAQLSFTGDDTTNPVSEQITITGTLTSDLYLKVLSYGKFSGTGPYNGLVTYSHGGIATNCNPETTQTCVPCQNYNCPDGQHPVCDGSTTVTCTQCASGEKWNVAAQRCEAVAPMCFGMDLRGQPQTWSTAQKGVIHQIGGMNQPPSDGCCSVTGADAAIPSAEHFCKSTGDPHILQFNGQTNHAYINGDYIMYQGQKLSVSLRHVNHGVVAGNNGFVITGELLDNHKLEYYDQDTVSDQPNRASPLIYIDGNPVVAGASGDIFQTACAFFTDAHIVCACKWQDGVLNLGINDKTVFKFDRWHQGLGWNNAFLQVDPLDKDPADVGMCTYTATTNTPAQAGKADADPYPLARHDCTGGHSNDPFTLQSGVASNGAFHNNYFCMAASDMRRRRMDEEKRRRLSQLIMDCRRDNAQIFTLAYTICQPCTQLGNDATETCLIDACLMAPIATSVEEAAEFSLGEAAGCSEEIVMRTAPEHRGNVCPAGTDWDPDFQVCMGDFELKRSSTCAGNPVLTESTFIKDCHNKCKSDALCSAYVFDVYKNECKIFHGCSSLIGAEVQLTTYIKDTSGQHLARGGTLDGPQANYGGGAGQPTNAGNGNIPGPLDQLDNDLDNVHDNVDDLKDSVKSLHDELEGDVREVHAAVSELRTVLAALSASTGNQPTFNQPTYNQPTQPNYNQGMQPNYNQGMQPNYNNGYGQQGNNFYGQPNGVNPWGMPLEDPHTDNHNDDWKTVGIVSAVMSFILLCGAVTAVSVYFCCMKKN